MVVYITRARRLYWSRCVLSPGWHNSALPTLPYDVLIISNYGTVRRIVVNQTHRGWALQSCLFLPLKGCTDCIYAEYEMSPSWLHSHAWPTGTSVNWTVSWVRFSLRISFASIECSIYCVCYCTFCCVSSLERSYFYFVVGLSCFVDMLLSFCQSCWHAVLSFVCTWQLIMTSTMRLCLPSSQSIVSTIWRHCVVGVLRFIVWILWNLHMGGFEGGGLITQPVKLWHNKNFRKLKCHAIVGLEWRFSALPESLCDSVSVAQSPAYSRSCILPSFLHRWIH